MMKSDNFFGTKGAAQPEASGEPQELYNSKNASAESAIHFPLHFVARLEAFPESISTSDVLDGKLICRTESRFQRSCVSISSILGLCPRLTMKRSFGAKHLHMQ